MRVLRCVNVGVMNTHLYPIAVRCGNSRFRGHIWVDFFALLERYAGMAVPAGRKRNPFAQDVCRSMVAYLQNWSDIGKPFAHIGSVLSGGVLLNLNLCFLSSA